MAKPQGGRYVRARTALDAQIAAEKRYAPGRLKGAYANEKTRGSLSKRKFTGTPAKNAARRGS